MSFYIKPIQIKVTQHNNLHIDYCVELLLFVLVLCKTTLYIYIYIRNGVEW